MTLSEKAKLLTAYGLMSMFDDTVVKPRTEAQLEADDKEWRQRQRLTYEEQKRLREEAAAPWRAERAARKAAAWAKRQPKKKV